ncbi:hypothetical protein Glaag_2567 [Glaciecola sp. 4H-3-7+YE-5]|nr:hypothetical protein Glaag_2567 [Glaciecola sp. 4H-3-7+YE-5]
MNTLIAFTKPMNLTEAKFTKSEVLENSYVTSAQFNNWVFRGLVPRLELGFKLESFTRAKYSLLVIAYCRSLAYHTGPRKGDYVKILKQVFRQVAQSGEFNSKLVIAIDGFGRGKDCGAFENAEIAKKLFSRQCAIVPVGKILTNYIEAL